MRLSTTCKCLVKVCAIIITAKICLSLIGFYSGSTKPTNITVTTTPSPEEDLQNYIKNLSSWRESNQSVIINPHPYKYLHVPSNTCKLNGAVSDPFVLVIVKSYVSNIGHRESIRATWAKVVHPSVKVVFILGYLDFMKSYIQIESKHYKDIVQQDFIDVYRNNTVKTIMGFNWAVSNCAESSYLFFVDDDYIVNIPNVLEYLKAHYKRHDGQGSLYAGYRWEKAYPKRSNTSKWYVSEEDYPCKYWPPYVGGGSVVISKDIAKKMTDAFPHIKPIFIDDVYIGIVAATLGINVTMEGKFNPDYRPYYIDKLYSTHGFESSSVLIQDWEKIKQKVGL